MGQTPPDRGYGYKPPTTPKRKPKDTGDERGYRYSAPKVSPLYQHLQDNKVPYYGAAYQEYNQDQAAWKAQQQMQPTRPSGPASSGGSGGSGAVDNSAAAQAALQSMFQIYNRPQDSTLQDNLNRIIGQAQQTGTDSLAQLQAALGGQSNPYAGQVASATVADNPLAQYMQAGGVDTAGVDAARSLNQSTSDTITAADQRNRDMMGQSWNNMQQSRQGDAAFLGQQFAQALANSGAAYQAQIVQQQKKAKDDLMMQILQMAVSSGQDLGKLGITF